MSRLPISVRRETRYQLLEALAAALPDRCPIAHEHSVEIKLKERSNARAQAPWIIHYVLGQQRQASRRISDHGISNDQQPARSVVQRDLARRLPRDTHDRKGPYLLPNLELGIDRRAVLRRVGCVGGMDSYLGARLFSYSIRRTGVIAIRDQDLSDPLLGESIEHLIGWLDGVDAEVSAVAQDKRSIKVVAMGF